jgi:hypothetical protein
MPRETNPKPKQKPDQPEPAGSKEEEKNVDRDGRERQPTEHTDQK